MKTGFSIIGIVIFVCLCACQRESLTAPDHYEDIDLSQSDLTLGRVLFYDKHLSVNNTISCASCHKQELAFADNVAFSKGFNNRLTLRNSMPIQNLASNFFDGNSENTGPLFWDGREQDIHQMVLKPVLNHVEMGINDLELLCNKLNEIEYYQILLERTYEYPTKFTPKVLSLNLTNFVLSIQGVSELDKGLLTAEQSYGADLFINKYDCNVCHQVQSPSGYLSNAQNGFANIGLDISNTDQGLGAVTGIVEDVGKFKIPSLRNVTLTAPYMHDGRFKNLSQVLDHYIHGMQNNPNLDFSLRDENGNSKKPKAVSITKSV